MATWQLARKKQVVQLPWGLSDTKVIVDFLSAYHSIYAWPLCFSPFFPSPFSSFLLWSLFFSCLIRSNVFSNSFRFSKGCQIWPPLWNYNSNTERQEATSRVIWLHCMKISSNCLIYLSRQYMQSTKFKWYKMAHIKNKSLYDPQGSGPWEGASQDPFLMHLYWDSPCISKHIPLSPFSYFIYTIGCIPYPPLCTSFFHTIYLSNPSPAFRVASWFFIAA